MGYKASGKLADFGRVEPMVAAQRRTVERVGHELLLLKVIEYTPVAKPPPGAEREWLEARKRAPGELKRSWQIGELTVEIDGVSMKIDVWTEDRIAPFVEWPTLPHIIVPRRPGGWLRFWNRFGGVVFARLVHHPGTAGSYMMTRAAAQTAVEWQAIGHEEMVRWAHDQARLVNA